MLAENPKCTSQGHKLLPLFFNEQRVEVIKNEPVILNKETYQGHICSRCGVHTNPLIFAKKFHTEEG